MTLEELRQIIDQLNAEIIALFSKRLHTTQKIAQFKKDHQLPIDDPLREHEQMQRCRALAKKNGLSPTIMEEIFCHFVNYSKLRMKMDIQQSTKEGST
jgi:chorismate mutase